MSLLQVDDVTKSFASRSGFFSKNGPPIQAVRGVSLHIAAGETLGLVGESGCGKSTLGRCVIRLIQPTSGRVIFDGQDVTSASPAELRQMRRKMQIIFQDPYSSLNPRQTIGASIMEGMDIHSIHAQGARRDAVVDLLEKVGLKADHVRNFPHEFSGGQRQRIVIARALAVGPQFIVADEAVSALDVSIQAQILNLLLDLQEMMNLTYLFISHNLHVVRHISDRVAVMYLGRIVETASADDIYLTPRHPYTKALLSAALIPDPQKPPEMVIATGDVPSPINPPSGCAFRTRCPLADEVCARVDPHLIFKGTHGVACHYAAS
jgi:oligopeptide transport system ATP-binding protein